MPSGTTIGHVHLHVGNLDEARVFYHAGLGLDLMVWSYPSALFMSAGGYHHHLGVNTWAGPQARPASAKEPRLGYWELVLPTSEAVAAAVSSLAGAGFAPSLEEVGGSVVADPWGTELRLTTSN
jgi:catechol 2,3-dioxygenase